MASQGQGCHDEDSDDGFRGPTAATPSATGSAAAASVSRGRFAEQWHESEAHQRKDKRQFVSRALTGFSRALDGNRCEAAIAAAEALVSSGEKPPNDLMVRLMHAVADLPGVERFSEAVSVCVRGDIQFEILEYASLVGRLMARDAPAAQVRAALNFGVSKTLEPLPLAPADANRESDIINCFEGAEHIDIGELSDEDDVAVARRGKRGGKRNDETPKSLTLSGCSLLKKLNGEYKQCQTNQFHGWTQKPVFRQVTDAGDRDCKYAYHFAPPPGEETEEWGNGWYLGTEVGGGGVTFAYCPGDVALPPARRAWQFLLSKGGRKEEPLTFVRTADARKPTTSKKVIVDCNEAAEALGRINLHRLRGRVVGGGDPETTKYFLHFFVLLHLEALAEVAGFRGRFNFRTAEELADFGIATIDAQVEDTWGFSRESRRMPLPGWPEAGNEKVVFKLASNKGFNAERFAMKRGESVLISCGDPLKTRVTEGSVMDVDIQGRSLTAVVNGKFPDFDTKIQRFRLDVYANRTTFERQLTALLQFVTMRTTKMQEMLIAAGVGRVDLAVLAGDGFADPSATTTAADLPAEPVKEVNDEEADEAVAAPATPKGETPEVNQEALVDGATSELAPKEKAGDPNGQLCTREFVAPQGEALAVALAIEEAEDIDQKAVEEAKELVHELPDLSAAQRCAINSSLSKRATIVQGPPGTGKTHTSVRILTMWAKTLKYKPLLATSECNIAVDNIADGLARAGVSVVRVGRPDKIRDILEDVCLDNMVKAERIRREEEEKEEKEDESDDELGEEPSDEEGDAYRKWTEQRKVVRRKRQWDRQQDAFARMRHLQAAEVICATTVATGSHALSGFKFRAILIDEVAQATEPSALVPIICRGAQQVALCGDHCQLPPNTLSMESKERGMSMSLYSRLVEAGVPFNFLDTQYRAHPNLMAFSAACVYQGKLKNGITGSQRPVPKGIPWPNPDNPAAFFECGAEEGLNGESKANKGEADFVLKLVRDALDYGELGLTDIGIVTPYKGQVRQLRALLFTALPEAAESRELEIASVDNFQGREKELIIFSAVRCNDKGSVGFLSDWRRLNVMITRARRGLVVVGSAATLVCDKHWRLWLQFTEEQGGCPQGTVEAAMVQARDDLEGSGKSALARKLFPEVVKPAPIVAVPAISNKSKQAAREATWDDSTAWSEENTVAQPPPKRQKAVQKQAQAEDAWEEDEDEWDEREQAAIAAKKRVAQTAAKAKAKAADDQEKAAEEWAEQTPAATKRVAQAPKAKAKAKAKAAQPGNAPLRPGAAKTLVVASKAAIAQKPGAPKRQTPGSGASSQAAPPAKRSAAIKGEACDDDTESLFAALEAQVELAG